MVAGKDIRSAITNPLFASQQVIDLYKCRRDIG